MVVQGAPNKGKHYPIEVLTDHEVRSLIRACSNRAPTGIRNRAVDHRQAGHGRGQQGMRRRLHESLLGALTAITGSATTQFDDSDAR